MDIITGLPSELRTNFDARLKHYYDKDCCQGSNPFVVEGFVNTNMKSGEIGSMRVTPGSDGSYRQLGQMGVEKEHFEDVLVVPPCGKDQVAVLGRYCVVKGFSEPCN